MESAGRKVKKDKREIFRILTNEINATLCPFCRYCENDGGSLCEYENYSYCTHPIEVISDIDHEMTPYDDCWGFNPFVPLTVVVDFVGIVLREGFSRWQYWKDGGEIYYLGIKRENSQSP